MITECGAEGGDPACWLAQVCADCGTLTENPRVPCRCETTVSNADSAEMSADAFVESRLRRTS